MTVGSVCVVVGVQWGDEGKGKVVDILAESADVIARYQGGANAGHTVRIGEAEYISHLIPVGGMRSGKICVLGNGMVVDPTALFDEIDTLHRQGISDIEGRLRISERAHLTFRHHKAAEAQQERKRRKGKLGTTGRGIGTTYEDKIGRRGIMVGDLRYPEQFAEQVREYLRARSGRTRAWLHRDQTDRTIQQYLMLGEHMRPMMIDASQWLNAAHREGKSLLLEGAQGTFLDIDHGTYPFVTSSNTTAGGACTGLGIGPTTIDTVTGVMKAYTTRVGEGPFPTELTDARGTQLRENGKEFGATTGRPRRCGWLDTMLLRYAIDVNGIHNLAMTKLDVLDTVPEISICTGYEIDGEAVTSFPYKGWLLGHAQPVYGKKVDGWLRPTSGARGFDELPPEAQRYVGLIEELVGRPITIISVGKERMQTIFRN